LLKIKNALHIEYFLVFSNKKNTVNNISGKENIGEIKVK